MVSSCSVTGKPLSSFQSLLAALIILSPCMGPALMAQQTRSAADLVELSLEELADIQITSVSRRSENLSEAPAAVYVISRADIIRSGVRSIPEALRLAPGVEVVRQASNNWSISIRGFNIDLSNKLLVLIDGRSVYSPLYAGVNWDVQDALLEDIERIEVIAGPGGTLWGANAVNGVINIITRSASETTGAYVEAGSGNEEQGFGAIRYGGQIGENLAARAYIKYFERDASRLAATGEDGVDDWRMLRGGFRMDWESRTDVITLQGDVYDGVVDGIFPDEFTLGTLPGAGFADDAEITGVNLLGRWTRELESDASYHLQVYYDRTKRNIPNNFNETRETFDIDFQHHLMFGGRHDIVWGVGIRVTGDKLDDSLYTSFDPDSRTDDTYSFFLQDRIDLWNKRLYLTLGSKFEENDYTGFEIQPSARLNWLASERQTLWGAVSRAVRIPSRLDTDLLATVPVDAGFPLYVTINGNDDFHSEELLAYEAGYRVQATDDLTFDVTVFYHDYDDLQSAEPGEPVLVTTPPPLLYVILPNTIDNKIYGESYGTTAMAIWKPVPAWRLQFQYTYFDLHQHNKPGGMDADPEHEGNTPENQFAIHSFADLPGNFSLYTGARYVDALPFQDIGDYVAVDVSLNWQALESLTLSVTGQNLNRKSHPEFGAGNEIERSVYGMIIWRF